MLLFLFAKPQECIVAHNLAINYVEKEISLSGLVHQVSAEESINGSPRFLNFSDDDPNYVFKVVIWENDVAELI